MDYKDLAELFCESERRSPPEHLTAHIVFTEDSFYDTYTCESRTYVVSSDNKAYRPNMGGYSIFASCLDGTDPCVRLDWFMADEKGDWKVEECYLVDGEGKRIDEHRQ